MERAVAMHDYDVDIVLTENHRPPKGLQIRIAREFPDTDLAVKILKWLLVDSEPEAPRLIEAGIGEKGYDGLIRGYTYGYRSGYGTDALLALWLWKFKHTPSAELE